MAPLAKVAFLSLVAMVAAEGYDSHPPSGGYGSYPPSHNRGGYGYQYRYNPYPVMRDLFSGEEPLDLVDKLWGRVDNVVAQNKFAAEQLDAVIARMSLIKKLVDELELTTFPELYRSNVNQNNDINNTWDHLNDLMTKLNGLDGDIDWLETQNGRNSNYTQDLENAWAGEKREDVDQDGDVASLYAAVTDFKSKLFTVLGNEFELFADQVETTAGKLAGTKGREQPRMCEVGTTSLLGDDRVVEYVFQSDFDEVPSVQYSITDINWNLDAREDPQHYGYGPPPQEPNAAGFVILAYPTKRSVVFRGYDFSFGDSQGINGNINFIACTIGPGTEESDAHDVTPAPATTYGN